MVSPLFPKALQPAVRFPPAMCWSPISTIAQTCRAPGRPSSRSPPAGATSVFYQGPAGVGLTTALGVLRSGFVLVGNVPTTDGTSATISQGSLIVLDKSGNQVADFTNPALLDGPWDLVVVDSGA